MKTIFIICIALVLAVACNEAGNNNNAGQNDPAKNVESQQGNENPEPAMVEITEEWGNKKCPVMPDDDVDKEKFVVYEGKKVYFCCGDCISTFEKDPKKYHDFLALAKK